MLLRSTLEKHIPVLEDEKHLSQQARRATFRGSYIFPSKISEVRSETNYNRESRKAFPYLVVIERQFSDGTISIGGENLSRRVYKEPSEIIAEMKGPRALNRANRIERIARRIKATAACVTLATLGGLGVYSALTPDKEPTSESIDSCEEVVSGNETLVGVETRALDELSENGQTLCSIGDEPFIVSRPQS